MTHLWGKPIETINAERAEAIATRERLAHRDDELRRQRAMTPAELGAMYGDRLRPMTAEQMRQNERNLTAARDTTTWVEVEQDRAKSGEDDKGHVFFWIALAAIAGSLATAWIIWP